MDRCIHALCKGIEALIALALALMVVLVFGNVVLRYGFNTGITVSEEVSRWLFIWATFLGAVVALHDRAHLGVDMVVRRLPRLGRRACLLLGHALMLYILVLLFQGSLEQTRINWNVSAPTTGWSMAWVTTPALVFATLAALLLLIDMVRALRGQLDGEQSLVRSSEEADQLRQVLAGASQQDGADRGGRT